MPSLRLTDSEGLYPSCAIKCRAALARWRERGKEDAIAVDGLHARILRFDRVHIYRYASR